MESSKRVITSVPNRMGSRPLDSMRETHAVAYCSEDRSQSDRDANVSAFVHIGPPMLSIPDHNTHSVSAAGAEAEASTVKRND